MIVRLPLKTDTVHNILYCRRINDIIKVMTSRFPAEALRPNSAGSTALSDFLEYLTAWEQHAGGDGFLSDSTATGLRVTLSSTLELLSYLTSLGYKFIMTSRLSQDPLENVFGIVRQSSGCNDHPTPSQFLVTMNCLSFYSLVKTVRYGNADPCAITALLDVEGGTSAPPRSSLYDQVDDLIESGDLSAAETILSCSLDHDQHVERSDARLIHYIAGYVARKCVMKMKCEHCMQLLTSSTNNDKLELARLTLHKDKGGLLYPHGVLFRFVRTLENLFTECFSKTRLHAESMLDILTLVKARCTLSVGCSKHAALLTKEVISFYITTRLHFFVKGLNSDNKTRRERAKRRKMTKTS